MRGLMIMDRYELSGSYPKWQIHTVEIDLQWDEYKGTIRHQIRGNCLGASILQSTLSIIESGEYQPKDDDSKKHVLLDVHGYFRGFRLFDQNGDELILDADDDLMDCIVGVRIVDVKPEQQ
jgi:hypothetical protein